MSAFFALGGADGALELGDEFFAQWRRSGLAGKQARSFGFPVVGFLRNGYLQGFLCPKTCQRAANRSRSRAAPLKLL